MHAFVGGEQEGKHTTGLHSMFSTPKLNWEIPHSHVLCFEREQWSYGFMSFPKLFHRESVSLQVSPNSLCPASVRRNESPTPLSFPFPCIESLVQNWATAQFYLGSSTLKIIICGRLPLGRLLALLCSDRDLQWGSKGLQWRAGVPAKGSSQIWVQRWMGLNH